MPMETVICGKIFFQLQKKNIKLKLILCLK